eukprot:1160859-Pelagomonas_calceolata.AAC.12
MDLIAGAAGGLIISLDCQLNSTISKQRDCGRLLVVAHKLSARHVCWKKKNYPGGENTPYIN